MRPPRWVPSLSALLDAKAEHLREVTATHGLARYAEGYRDGYLAGAERQAEIDRAKVTINPTIELSPDLFAIRCGYLGCTEPIGHDGVHVVRDANT